MKKANDTIGNRTRDLLTCSAVPQPTAPPPAPTGYLDLRIIKTEVLRPSIGRVKRLVTGIFLISETSRLVPGPTQTLILM